LDKPLGKFGPQICFRLIQSHAIASARQAIR
jgi:hypothetical protein